MLLQQVQQCCTSGVVVVDTVQQLVDNGEDNLKGKAKFSKNDAGTTRSRQMAATKLRGGLCKVGISLEYEVRTT